jgi:hypothetical protein
MWIQTEGRSHELGWSTSCTAIHIRTQKHEKWIDSQTGIRSYARTCLLKHRILCFQQSRRIDNMAGFTGYSDFFSNLYWFHFWSLSLFSDRNRSDEIGSPRLFQIKSYSDSSKRSKSSTMRFLFFVICKLFESRVTRLVHANGPEQGWELEREEFISQWIGDYFSPVHRFRHIRDDRVLWKSYSRFRSARAVENSVLPSPELSILRFSKLSKSNHFCRSSVET